MERGGGEASLVRWHRFCPVRRLRRLTGMCPKEGSVAEREERIGIEKTEQFESSRGGQETKV